MGASKIAISLPEELLREIDREARAHGRSRSEFVRDAVTDFFRRRAQQEALARYADGYASAPEDEDEIEAALQTAVAALAQEPWE